MTDSDSTAEMLRPATGGEGKHATPRRRHESEAQTDFAARPSGIVGYSVKLRQQHHDAVNTGAMLNAPSYEFVWDAEKNGAPKHRWIDSPLDQSFIRLGSRGIAGAGMMTGMDLLVKKHYLPVSAVNLGDMSVKEAVAVGNMTAQEALKFDTKLNRSMNFIAKWTYDIPFGAPLRAVFGDSMRFRRNTSFNEFQPQILGQDFGAEAFRVTAGFAAASLGDGWIRNVANDLDPNVKKPWITKDQNGHQHIVWKKAPAAIAHSALRLVDYSAMEDIVVAPAYILCMKGHRHFSEWMSPGSRLMLEANGNGGGLRVDKNGQVEADYAMTGLRDYQWRFPIYNVFTEIFRDAVNDTHERYKHRHDEKIDGKHRPFLSEAAKYVVKTTIDTGMWMMPVMPAFSLARIAQGIANSPHLIHIGQTASGQKQSGFVFVHEPGQVNAVKFVQGQAVAAGSTFSVGRTAEEAMRAPLHTFDEKAIEAMLHIKAPLDHEARYGRAYNFLKPLSRLNANVTNKIADVTGGATEKLVDAARYVTAGEHNSERPGFAVSGSTRNFVKAWAENAASYYPYMDAKYKGQQWVDTPQMGSATMRMEDGVANGNLKEAGAGLTDMGRALMKKPVSAETRKAMYEPRGLINSTQMTRDAGDMRDKGLEENYIDRIREERLKTQQERRSLLASLTGQTLPLGQAANMNMPDSKITQAKTFGAVANENTKLGVAAVS